MFTGLYSLKEPGQYPYLTMDAEPESSGSGLRRGRPPYERMGREIHFGELPESCRRRVIEIYRELWNL
ncbi:MAG TPA: hypothetical protein VHM16_08475 [Rubrobacteraceae bacterium]|nr:hypothetical protein [Rubrobacteraceae bacterium]